MSAGRFIGSALMIPRALPVEQRRDFPELSSTDELRHLQLTLATQIKLLRCLSFASSGSVDCFAALGVSRVTSHQEPPLPGRTKRLRREIQRLSSYRGPLLGIAASCRACVGALANGKPSLATH